MQLSLVAWLLLLLVMNLIQLVAVAVAVPWHDSEHAKQPELGP